MLKIPDPKKPEPGWLEQTSYIWPLQEPKQNDVTDISRNYEKRSCTCEKITLLLREKKISLYKRWLLRYYKKITSYYEKIYNNVLNNVDDG